MLLDRLIAPFDPDRGTPPRGVLGLIISDYLAACRGTSEPPWRLALMFLPRIVYHTPLHATLMIRLALGGPRPLFGFWRTLLVAKHSIDLEGPLEIGPGLLLPHPISIVLGKQSRIGANVLIQNHVTIGARYREPEGDRICPDIRDGVTIFAQAIVVGPITVGENAIVGARSWIDKDVPPGAVVRPDVQHVTSR